MAASFLSADAGQGKGRAAPPSITGGGGGGGGEPPLLHRNLSSLVPHSRRLGAAAVNYFAAANRRLSCTGKWQVFCLCIIVGVKEVQKQNMSSGVWS
ncbi:hypothetical protein EJB05_07744, partial [Eragrostis curvula]